MNDTRINFEIIDPPTDKFKVICRDCAGETFHTVITTYREHGDEDCGHGNSFQWTTYHETIQCQGCEAVTFRVRSSNSEEYDHDWTGEVYHAETFTYYPNRFAGVQHIDSYILPEKVRDIYSETVLAIENDQNILCGIGIRAIIETVCKDLSVPGNNLFEKIDALHAQSIITKEGLDTLHKLRVLGNDSAHDVKPHKKDVLILALEVIRHMLDGTYVLPKKVADTFPTDSN